MKYKEDVDVGVEHFRESDYFKKMSKNDQIKEMNEILKIYKNNMIIISLDYDSESEMFSFQYNYGELKGALGGVLLKEWGPKQN